MYFNSIYRRRRYSGIEFVPTPSTPVYTGNSQSPIWVNYDENKLEISGETSGITAGTYTVTFTPKEGFMWWDNTRAGKSVTWEIKRATITTVPSQSGTLTFNGSAQSPSWSNYNDSQLTLGGVTSGTNAATYTATFTPTANYAWSDGSTGAKNVNWTITVLTLAKPTISNNSKTYNGNAQSPTITSYNASYMTQGGTISATDYGNYTVTYTLKSTTNTTWVDGSTGVVSLSWSIAKAAGSVTVNPTTLSIQQNNTGTISVTRSGNGAISVNSSDTKYATVSLNGTTVTVKGIAVGPAIVTVNVAAGTNHNATSKDVPVTVTLPAWTGSTTLGDTVIWAGKQWIVVHVEDDRVYLGYAVCEETTMFGNSNTYQNSIIQQKCATFENNLPANDLAMALETGIYNVTAKIFIATQDQVTGGFSYFKDMPSRIWNNKYGSPSNWWISTPSYPYNYAYCIKNNGDISNMYITQDLLFRPFVALRR